MSGAVLAEGQVAVENAGFRGRECAGAQIFPAEETVDGTRGDARQECAARIDPGIGMGDVDSGIDGVSGAEEYGTRRAEGDQLVGIDGQVAPLERAGVPPATWLSSRRLVKVSWIGVPVPGS